jgi:UDP-N-acetylmuramate dehydrogenase
VSATPEAGVDLRGSNTLRLPCIAEWCADVQDAADIPRLLVFARERGLRLRVLGGGSNVLLPESLPGLLLRMRNTGIELLEDSASRRVLRAAAGEPWHPFVLHCHAQGWHGLENLALIPGTVGAAPIQNIGAYGVELDRFVLEVRGIDLQSGSPRVLGAAQCAFAYRDSIFKGARAGGFLVTDVLFVLPRPVVPCTGYAALAAELAQCPEPGPAEVLAAVMAIRRRRLPDPALLPNAGSFFKNPVVSAEVFGQLLRAEPGIVHWLQADGRVKLAAAWLVERCGWKGHSERGVGVHDAQALVLVNHGGGTVAALTDLAARIRESVRERFGVLLELEPVPF